MNERERHKGWQRRLLTSVLSALVTGALVVFLPRAVGSTWHEVGDVLARLSVGSLILLAVVWLAGLWAHSFALAASLPGLTKRRALTLSLTGSAVANVLPLGGAVGTALNFTMVRRWGFTRRAFGGFITVTTLLNVVSKLGVIAIALGLVPVLHSAAAFSPTSLLFLPVPVAVLVGVWILVDERVAKTIGRQLDKVFRRSRLEERLPRFRRTTLHLMRTGWRPMTGGMVAYLALQLALLWLCFQVLHVPLGLAVLFTALAVERLLTLVPITPGSAGVVEIGTTAALVALGGDPAGVAAGLLLFRGFTFLMEIPVGGVMLAIWTSLQRRTRVAVA
ncbi:lysylphosphatidylglycerol synthase transmembrane domain-containing protein [Kribbella sp.]|uniref:lysylphosphatidylglycerol synthase transmembrane domain-containing protein n=1 Tax=Kribbella sp. TaxID=1871183 RepID=UPI002D4C434F|nr:lysylphosphatidylglycerol synthase transmembrane domain-containing protein [Kribbella sp.]HZX07231.1 lysylphosphatidylglycerol synthase transmembrane domain-containing protein [Kribbella sp.]